MKTDVEREWVIEGGWEERGTRKEKERGRERKRERERFIDMLEWNHRSTEQT